MVFHTILTHEHPDLDAMLCCYLLQRYGEQKYPAIQQAQVQFCPAGRLPDDKIPEELEKEGILAVDIGGGRLDNHPQGSHLAEEKLSMSAANLVALNLGLVEQPSLKYLLEFTRMQDSVGQSLRSKNPVDHLMALPNLIKGALLYFGQDFSQMTLFFKDVFAAIEIAALQEKRYLALAPDSYLLAFDQDNLAFAPDTINLKSLCAAYLAKKYLGREVALASSPPTAGRHWNNFDAFLQDNGLNDYPELKKMITFLRNLSPESYLLHSDNLTDRAVSLVNIIDGFCYLCPDRSDILAPVFCLFDCIIAHEKNWHDAIDEYQEKRLIYELEKSKIVAIRATRGSVSKVARWQDKPDLIIFQDELQLHVSISINKLGRLKNYTLNRMAARIRMAEVTAGYPTDVTVAETYLTIGEIANWFLHQSEKLLVHGSPKARREPSLLPFETIIELVLTELDRLRKLPDRFCPPDRCLHHDCPFYALRLPNCFHHREKLRIVGNSEMEEQG